MTGNKPSMAHGRTPQAARKGLKVLPGVAGWGVWCAGAPAARFSRVGREFRQVVASDPLRRRDRNDSTPKSADAGARARRGADPDAARNDGFQRLGFAAHHLVSGGIYIPSRTIQNVT